MSKPILHFAHANGFPAKVYTKLLNTFQDDYDIIYKPTYGQDENYPINTNWINPTNELVDFIRSKTTEPVLGIGHSFGATITLNAAIFNPELFHTIVLIEPVIVNGWRSKFAPFLDYFDLIKYFSPAMKSKDRRAVWSDMESAEAYFRSKRLFNQLDEDCLQDYLKYGLTNTENGYELTFKVENEVAIFSNLPFHFDQYKGRLKSLNGYLISADKTNISIPAFMRRLANHHNFKWDRVPGSHMLPLEKPIFTADLIKQFLASSNAAS